MSDSAHRVNCPGLLRSGPKPKLNSLLLTGKPNGYAYAGSGDQGLGWQGSMGGVMAAAHTNLADAEYPESRPSEKGAWGGGSKKVS